MPEKPRYLVHFAPLYGKYQFYENIIYILLKYLTNSPVDISRFGGMRKYNFFGEGGAPPFTRQLELKFYFEGLHNANTVKNQCHDSAMYTMNVGSLGCGLSQTV